MNWNDWNNVTKLVDLTKRVDELASSPLGGMAQRDNLSRFDAMQTQIDALHARLNKVETPTLRPYAEKSVDYVATEADAKRWRVTVETPLWQRDPPEVELRKDIRAFWLSKGLSRAPYGDDLTAWLISRGYKKG